MKALTTFLSLLMPQLGPVLMRSPELVMALRSAFTRVGGKDADFDKILTDNQVDIDRLANPDSFRRTKGAQSPPDKPDPSKIVFPTKDAAKAALHAEFVYVLEMADGTFRIWPAIGPLPGKKVWPK